MIKGHTHSLWRLGFLALLFTLFLHGFTGRGQSSDPPSITSQPQSLTTNAGTFPRFTVQVSGTIPMAFQWFKDAQPLTNGSAYSGAQTDALTVNYAQKVDEGEYRVMVTNEFGSATSSNATLTVRDPAILTHPQNRNLPLGASASFTAAAVGTPPYTYQWQFNGQVLPNATNTTSPLIYGAISNAGNYQFVTHNAFGSATSAPAVLTVNATTLDGLSADANGLVHATAIQGDGRIVVGGSFTGLGIFTRNRIGRLLPNGQVDTQFNPNANQDVYCLLQRPDGKLLVGGAFTTLGGKTCRYLGRLHANGTLDTNFNVTVNGAVYCLAWQRDGHILAGGASTLRRFDQNGVADSTFNPAFSGTIYAIAEDASVARRILVGGGFSSIAGSGRQNLARLNSNGTLDTTYNLPVAGIVYAMGRQTDGGLLLGGAFSAVGLQPRPNLARLDAGGNLSPDFNPGASNTVYTIAFQADGKILLGGNFNRLAGVDRSFLARMNPDGSIDPLFNPGANNTVYSLALQADGELVAGGNFSFLGGATRSRLGRLNATGDATQTLAVAGGTIAWLRSGGVPEVEEVVFEAFQPGNGWVSLGVGERVPGGWQASAAVDPDLTLRARGKAVGGRGAGSGSIIEFASGPVVILTEPVGASVSGTASVILSVEVSGTGPFQFQWYRNGVALADGTSAVYPNGIIGSYQVVVCNALGCVQSQVATIWRLNTVESAARPNPNSTVHALAVQADGKILIGGSFTNFAGTQRRGLARMNGDGSFDDSFNPDVAGGSVFCLAVLPDARIVVGGTFTNVGGQARSCLARLHPDGSLDGLFVANVTAPFDGGVYCLALESGGRILAGGHFHSIAGQARTDLARLESSGSVDPGFVPPPNLHPLRQVNSILPLANGTILLGGRFANGPGYQAYQWVQENGSYAGSGYPVPIQMGLSSVVYAMLVQPDGEIILGGSDFHVDAQGPRTLARLNADHSPDTSFTAYANGPVMCLAAQADGMVLVGGAFTALNGVTRNNVGRLHPDGSLDSNFNPGISGTNGAMVGTVAVQLDGKVALGGLFTTVSTGTRYNFARLPVTAAASEDWSYNGSALAWLRDGPPAEFETLTLESSADGVAWQALFAGARISGGWQFTGVSLPLVGQTRARGAVVSSGVSAGQTQTLLASPVITSQPLSRTNALGSLAGFYVSVQGPAPFGYQWYRNSVALEDGGEVTGAHGPLLSFRVHEADAGQYRVEVTNLFGSVTSEVAELSWVDPATPALILASEPGFGFQAGRFSFRYQAIPGQTCVVEYSSSLRFWFPLRTNVVNSWTPVTFTDPDTTPDATRFYRVRLR